jgi:hypothetical protein
MLMNASYRYGIRTLLITFIFKFGCELVTDYVQTRLKYVIKGKAWRRPYA